MPDHADAILVDANLLLWAHHSGFDKHAQTEAWWSSVLSSTPIVGIPWLSTLAFLRISTHPRVFDRPLTAGEAWSVVDGWLQRPNVTSPGPTERHAAILEPLIVDTPAPANHTTDAHLAAIAIEWGLELQSADSDFARYEGLRWRNPLRPVRGSTA